MWFGKSLSACCVLLGFLWRVQASSIRVGLLLDYETSAPWDNTTSSWLALMNQLQNNTGTVTSATPIQVSLFFTTNMTADATTLKSQVDTLLIGNAGAGSFGAVNPSAFATICNFVMMGGGVVFHGFALDPNTWYSLNDTQMSLLEQCAPITTYSTDASGFWTPASTLDIETSHPITTGLPSQWDATMMASYITGAYRLTGNAVGLGVNASNPCCVPAPDASTIVSYMAYGSGRTAFVGMTYSGAGFTGQNMTHLRSGNADQLLRQAIVWSTGVGAVTTTGNPTTAAMTTARSLACVRSLPLLLSTCLLALFISLL